MPVIPGLKILMSICHLTSIPRTFHCEIPAASAHEIAATPERARDIGEASAVEQVTELLESDVRSVHFYVLTSSRAVNAVLAKLRV